MKTLLSLFVLGCVSWAAGYDNSDHATGLVSSSISYSGAASCAAGDTLMVVAGVWQAASTPPTLNTPAMSGQTFTLIGSQTNLVSSSSSSRSTAWYTTNIPHGAPAITVSASASADLDLWWECFTGYNTLDQWNANSEAGTGISVNTNPITTTHGGEFVITWWLNQTNANIWSMGTGTRRLAYAGPADTVGIGDITESIVVSNFSITWSGSSANSIAGIASFYNVTHGASPTMPPTVY